MAQFLMNMVHWLDQGWGGPAVQYRQSTPVLGNLGPVTDWRSTFCSPGLDWERQSYGRAKGPVLARTSKRPTSHHQTPSSSHFAAVVIELRSLLAYCEFATGLYNYSSRFLHDFGQMLVVHYLGEEL